MRVGIHDALPRCNVCRLEFTALVVGVLDPLLQRSAQTFQDPLMRGRRGQIVRFEGPRELQNTATRIKSLTEAREL